MKIDFINSNPKQKLNRCSRFSNSNLWRNSWKKSVYRKWIIKGKMTLQDQLSKEQETDLSRNLARAL